MPNIKNVSPSTDVRNCCHTRITAMGWVTRSHRESCVALHLPTVSSPHSWHPWHLDRFPGEYVPISHT